MNQITSTCPVDQPMIKPNQQNIIIKCLHIVLPLIGESCLDTVEQLLIVKCLTEYKVVHGITSYLPDVKTLL